MNKNKKAGIKDLTKLFNFLTTKYPLFKENKERKPMNTKENTKETESLTELDLANKTIEHLSKVNNKLYEELKYAKEFIYMMNAKRCPKCKNYYLPIYKCHNCGYDEYDEEDISNT